jgi:hypothetical protein
VTDYRTIGARLALRHCEAFSMQRQSVATKLAALNFYIDRFNSMKFEFISVGYRLPQRHRWYPRFASQ